MLQGDPVPPVRLDSDTITACGHIDQAGEVSYEPGAQGFDTREFASV
jgi:hypothetical protein